MQSEPWHKSAEDKAVNQFKKEAELFEKIFWGIAVPYVCNEDHESDAMPCETCTIIKTI